VQKIFEPIILILYLTWILLMGRYMVSYSVGNKYYKIFGSLALTLGLADGIYIIPRMYSVLTTGIEDNLRIIGWGRLGNAIIITIFFLVLYDAYNERYTKKTNKALNRTFFVLAFIRVIIIILPGNKWFDLNPSPTYALLRFVPIALMGVFLILIMYIHSKKYKDFNYKIMSIATFFAILFIEPLVFISNSAIGLTLFTICRTISLIFIILIGYKELRDINVLSRY